MICVCVYMRLRQLDGWILHADAVVTTFASSVAAVQHAIAALYFPSTLDSTTPAAGNPMNSQSNLFWVSRLLRCAIRTTLATEPS